MHARERLYLNASRDALVRAGDPKAAFLYANVGDEIPQSAADRFGLVDGKLKKASAPRHETLLGSDVQPAMIDIGASKSVQLGTVVAAAHKASGLSVAAWNELPGDQREELLVKMIETMRAQSAAKTAKPKTAKAKAEKAPPGSKEQKPADNKEQKPGENKGAGGNATT